MEKIVSLLPGDSRQLQKGFTVSLPGVWRKTILTTVYIQLFLASLWAPDLCLIPAVGVYIPGTGKVSKRDVCQRFENKL